MATFLNDTCTDTDNTVLSSHTGETGATWSQHGSTAGQARIVSNRIYGIATDGHIAYYTSGTPATAEYDVEGTLYHIDTPSNSNYWIGVAGRIDTGANTMYVASYEHTNGQWVLWRISGGSFSSLGTYSQTLSNATSYTVKLEIRDAAKKVYVDGVERISSADNTITAAGRAGIRGFGSTSTTTGTHIDAISASDAGGAQSVHDAWTEGAEGGDIWTADTLTQEVAVHDAWTEGSEHGEGFSTLEIFDTDDEGAHGGDEWTDTILRVQAADFYAHDEGSLSGDSWETVVSTLQEWTEGGEAGERFITDNEGGAAPAARHMHVRITTGL